MKQVFKENFMIYVFNSGISKKLFCLILIYKF